MELQHFYPSLGLCWSLQISVSDWPASRTIVPRQWKLWNVLHFTIQRWSCSIHKRIIPTIPCDHDSASSLRRRHKQIGRKENPAAKKSAKCLECCVHLSSLSLLCPLLVVKARGQGSSGNSSADLPNFSKDIVTTQLLTISCSPPRPSNITSAKLTLLAVGNHYQQSWKISKRPFWKAEMG